MLLKLAVRNYLLIHDLGIDFSGGFSVITGETGAGKSILLGALSLVLGQRADSGVLLNPSEKCVIEGHFDIRDYALENFFRDHDLEFDQILILRREIQENGKSRAFINDSPVNLAQLKELGDRLVNIHSQHSVITLNDANFQLSVLDSYAGIQRQTHDYRAGFLRLSTARARLATLLEAEVRSAADLDYFRFLLDELMAVKPVAGEVEELEQQLDELIHAEEIRNHLLRAGDMFTGEQENLLGHLSAASHLLDQAARHKPELQPLADRLNGNYIDLKDLAGEITAEGGRVVTDPGLADTLSQRLDLLNRLMKKHHAADVDRLLEVQQEIRAKVSGAAGLEGEIAILREEVSALEHELHRAALTLAAKREKASAGFAREVTNLLTRLGIPRAQFAVDLTTTGTLTRDGLNKVNFLFSANRGIGMKDLGATASGGELSRLMLAIKSMIGQRNLLPTIIFDEIDNGVSGEVAGKVGTILKQMGRLMQVIAITHLPQIAAKGERHYRVFKTEEGKMTITGIREIAPPERVAEIARLLSDEVVSDSAMTMAKELLNN